MTSLPSSVCQTMLITLVLSSCLWALTTAQGDYVDLSEVSQACADIAAEKGSTYYFIDSPTGDTINNLENICFFNLPPDGLKANRLVNINSQAEQDCLVRFIRQRMIYLSVRSTSLHGSSIGYNPVGNNERTYAIGLKDNVAQGVWQWQLYSGKGKKL